MVKRIFSVLLILMVFAGCTAPSEVQENEEIEDEEELIEKEDSGEVNDEAEESTGRLSATSVPALLQFAVENNEEFSQNCSVEDIRSELQETPLDNLHPDQITACYTLTDLVFAVVTEPNSIFVLESVRAWEAEGNTAWSGLLVNRAQEGWETFYTITEEDFNPVGILLEDEQLVLDIADDKGAGSGEGMLLRYVYPFATMEETLQWSKEKCDGYYVLETYSVSRGCSSAG